MFTGFYIWLRYTVNGVSYNRRFRPIDVRDILSKEGIDATGKRGNRYFHTEARYIRWAIRISADETYITAARNFLLSFWLGDRQYISFDQGETTPLDSTFIAVDTGDGDMPRELVEDTIRLQAFNFVLACKKPLLWDVATQTFLPQYIA